MKFLASPIHDFQVRGTHTIFNERSKTSRADPTYFRRRKKRINALKGALQSMYFKNTGQFRMMKF